MGQFIGRAKELKWLDRLFSGTGPGTCAIYGRRRLGKTTLLTHFCEGKDTFYFTASEGASKEDTLKNFTDSLNLFIGRDVGTAETFSGALRMFKELVGKRKMIMVIDEFPYLTGSVPGAASDIQVFIDRLMTDTNIFLIVCGSSISSMRSELEDKDKPLMGRFMNRTELKPMSFIECREFHKDLSDTENMSLFMILGGVPLYHKMTEGMTFREAVTEGFLSSFPQFSEEALSVIYRELSPSDDHIRILDAIAGGAVVQKEIADKTKIAQPVCSTRLRSMEFLGIIEKEVPMANAPKRAVYRISDKLLSFYFSVIRKRPAISAGTDPNAAYERIEHTIDSHFGHEFERVCRNYLASQVACVSIGRWWGRIGDDDTDIDIVAVVTDGKNDHSVFAECKYSKWKMERPAAEMLRYRSEYLKGMMNRKYVLFSKSGFDAELTEYSETENITLVTVSDMYNGTVNWRIF